MGKKLFRVRHNVGKMVEITFDAAIETPSVVHPCLPDVLGLIVLLGRGRSVAQVAQQMAELFAKLALYARSGASWNDRVKRSENRTLIVVSLPGGSAWPPSPCQRDPGHDRA